jgi:hypothetical protein
MGLEYATPINPAQRRERASAAMCAVSAVTLGFALQLDYGQYTPAALAPLGLALLFCLRALAAPGKMISARVSDALIALGLIVSFVLLLLQPPVATRSLSLGPADAPFRIAILVAAAAAFASFVKKGRAARLSGWLMIAAYVAAGLILIRNVPQPGVDVCTFQRESADTLLAGRNPYAITFEDPYHGKKAFYGKDVIRDGRTTWGYPYTPLPLLLALPGHLLGDFRFSMLAAMALAAALLLHARPRSRFGGAGAALLLFTPCGFFVLEAGWIEPFVILGLALTVFVACRFPKLATREAAMRSRIPPASATLNWARRRPGIARATPTLLLAIAAGLFLATKQYLVLALPLLTLLPLAGGWKSRLKFFGVTLCAAAAVTAPLALWDVPAFIRSVVTLQFHQPFRPDALSFLVPIAANTGQAPPTWIAFVAALAVIAFCLWRAPRTPAGFSLSLAAVFFAFFAFNKQAFCNYYHFVIAALCCGLAAQEEGGDAAGGAPARDALALESVGLKPFYI